jgi:hypothetical protein
VRAGVAERRVGQRELRVQRDRLLVPVSTSMSCALMRSRPPARWRLPSRTCATRRSEPTRGMSTGRPRYGSVLLRDITSRPGERASSVMIDSVNPSPR